MAALPDVKHNLNPVIGWLRLAVHDGKPLTEGQMTAAIEKLFAAIEAVEREESRASE